jgi:hypothetical protein
VKPDVMYLAALDDSYYAYFVTRVWWKPWRYNVWAQPMSWAPAQLVMTNISRDHALGLLKFFGAYNIGD